MMEHSPFYGLIRSKCIAKFLNQLAALQGLHRILYVFMKKASDRIMQMLSNEGIDSEKLVIV